MKKKFKPHIHKGRYYNHEHDRILPRIKGFLHIVGWHLLRSLKRSHKPFFPESFRHDEWHSTSPLVADAQQPSITWIGHATFLIQLDGLNIITDPVFFDISRFAARKMAIVHDLDAIPPINAMLISHNHLDHYNEKTLKFFNDRDKPLLCVPQGNKHRLDRLGFSSVMEFDWWQEHTMVSHTGKQINLIFLPANHWTSRGFVEINRSLWGSWLIQGSSTIYFAGDTAYGKHFSIINHHYPAIDIALMPIGPDQPRHLMHDAHVGPEEAVRGFIELGARYFIPMHWGTFPGGHDAFHEPIDELTRQWNAHADVLSAAILRIMKFGEQWNILQDDFLSQP